MIASVALIVVTTTLSAWVAHGAEVQVVTQKGLTIDFYRETHAMVVGVEDYDHWPSRPNAVQDARMLAWELKLLGFSVRLLTNPTSKQLWTALEEWVTNYGQQVEQGLVFYFSGNSHTQVAEDGNSIGWIIPKDAPAADPDRQAFEQAAVSTKELASIADQIQARHVLFMFDTYLTANTFEIEQPVLKVINQTSALSARQFITAGFADDTTTGPSRFRNFILKGLNGEADLVHDGLVSGSELGIYLADRIGHTTGGKQQAQSGRIIRRDENRGDFVFKLTDRIPDIAQLFVDTQPDGSAIRIMNIKPRFYQGIELKPGKYRLRVSAEGYSTDDRWVELDEGESRVVNVQLSEEPDEMTNSLGMRFVKIRPGTFTMGSAANEPGRSSDETPHLVKLTRRFFIQTTEVSVSQFNRYVQATGYTTEAEKTGGCWITGEGKGWQKKAGTSWKNPGKIKIADGLPVTCVTWNDAMAFASWLSKTEQGTYRLPTEAEWEHAGRAGTLTPFSTGRCLSTDEANYASIGHPYQKCITVFRQKRGQPIKTGTLAPNPWKLYNIHGNVSEWCLNWYGPYPGGNATNPTGPKSGSERVMRGGHWQADAAGCRSAKRWRFPPSIASDAVGFRMVMIP